MTKGLVLSPTGVGVADITSPGPDAGVLAGKTIGIRVDEMWRAWDLISEMWAQEFRKAGAKVEFWRSSQRTGEPGQRAMQSLDTFYSNADIAVVGLGNCGSCTSWTIHDALFAAAKGIPTIAIVTDNFVELGRNLARRGGRSGLRLHVLPYPLNECSQERVDTVGREHFQPVIESMGASLAISNEAAA
jgi:hypothetical protein